MIIKGSLNLMYCKKLKALNLINEIHGSLDMDGCINLESLRNLKRIGGRLDMDGCINLESLGDLEEIGYNLNEDSNYLDIICSEKLKSLGKLRISNGNLYCPPSLENLGDLEEVGRDLYLQNCKNLKSLGKLKRVDGKLLLKNSGITRKIIKKNYPQFLNKCFWW